MNKKQKETPYLAKGSSQRRFVSLSIKETARDNPEYFIREKLWNNWRWVELVIKLFFVLHISHAHKIQGKNEQALFFVVLFNFYIYLILINSCFKCRIRTITMAIYLKKSMFQYTLIFELKIESRYLHGLPGKLY